MKLGLLSKLFVTTLVVALLSVAVLPVGAVTPQASTAVLSAFENFIKSVSNGQAGVVRGVYVPGVLALPLRQQPVDHPGFISSESGVATQFGLAAVQDVIGLLAHYNRAGRSFFNLTLGQEVRVVYGDGSISAYTISAIYQYQALEPNSTSSDLVDLSTGVRISAADVFNTVYGGSHHVTFQTCIKKDGLLSWGRLFVVATPNQWISAVSRIRWF